MKKIVFGIVFLGWLFILNSCSSGGGDPHPIVPVPINPVITSFSINDATGIISGNEITVTLPYGTDVTSLVAKFTLSTPANVVVDKALQTSGETANNFTTAKTYTLTGNSTNNVLNTYTVTVLTAARTDKSITSFSLSAASGVLATSGDIKGHDITVTMPFGTNLSSLIATFTTTGDFVSIGKNVQISSTTINNFTNPIIYIVTASDGSTQEYTVTVSVAPSSAKKITAFSIANNAGKIKGHNISVTVPFGTNISSTVASYTTTGASVKVNSIPQDEFSVNDFTNPVVYTVIAADKTEAQYTVTVTVAPRTAKALIPPFLLDGYPGIINESQLTIDVTVPFGTPVTNMIATFNTTGKFVTVNKESQTSDAPPSNNFESPVAYVVHAEDGSTATYTVTVYATTNVWTWMGGSKSIDQYGVYGEKGIASTDNLPGARQTSISWTDSSGNMWLFGGYGYGYGQPPIAQPIFKGNLNDLWKYTPSNGEWVWMSGESTPDQYGTYGEKGKESQDNVPGSRKDSISWIDSSGYLWLFGGYGYGINDFAPPSGTLNDLWKYNISSKRWTWMSGESTTGQQSIYGEKGKENQDNIPGGRDQSTSWIDSLGNLWLFGGAEHSGEGIQPLNDLWKYNISSKKWTWMSGESIPNQYGIYGEKGKESQDSIPGARYGSISWVDASGKLWLFGGYGYGRSTGEASPAGSLNDLWKYTPSSDKWTWMSGESIPDQYGTYGEKGEESQDNTPGGRSKSISWIDSSGNLWLFGGYGYGYGEFSWDTYIGNLNDLWKYNVSSGKWVWVSGTNQIDQPSIYGTMGAPDLNNLAGSRQGSVSWIGVDGNLWLFGGAINMPANDEGNPMINDLWKYNP